MKQWTDSKSGEKYCKAVYCHPVYLTYMQNISCKILGWVKHKLESRLPREMSIISDMPVTPPSWQKEKRKTEEEVVAWHHRLNGQESDQTAGDSEGQGSLTCCSLWGCRVGYNLTAEQR